MHKLLTMSACLVMFCFPGACNGRCEDAPAKTDAGMRLAWAAAEHGILDDVIVYTCYASRHLGPHWYAELALDSSVFEFEAPCSATSLPTRNGRDTPDASGKSTLLRTSLGYLLRHDEVLARPYLCAAIGIGYTDIEGTSYPSDQAPDCRFEVDADDSLEIAPALSAGIRLRPRQGRWQFELGTSVEHRFVDWATTELNSGTTGRQTKIRTWAVFFGISATM